MMTIIPFTKRNGIKSVGAAMLAIFALCGFYILETETVIMVLGIEDAVNYAYPLIASIRRLDVDIFQILKRIDLVFITAWLTAAYFSVSFVLFATAEYARKIISKPNNKIVVFVIAVLAFVVSLLPEKDTDVYSYLTYTSIIFASMTIIVIPIILLIASRIKNMKKITQISLKIIAMLLATVTFTGCWDSLDIEKRDIVTALIVDKKEDHYYFYTEIAELFLRQY